MTETKAKRVPAVKKSPEERIAIALERIAGQQERIAMAAEETLILIKHSLTFVPSGYIPGVRKYPPRYLRCFTDSD